jgi:AcrR family transcriptional regulator
VTSVADVDPRIERSRRVVLAAALELLGEQGYGGLTIEAVAARAGVGKSTIYRHWEGKLALVEDAFRTLKFVENPPVGGTVRERVTAMLTQVATKLSDSTWSSCMPALIDAAERDDQVREVHNALFEERRAVLVGLLEEGVSSGELPAGTDLVLVAETLIGPLIVRRLLTSRPMDPAGVPALVTLVLGPGEGAPPSNR